MSNQSDQYFPGLEGVIASESAICNLEGREGSGGLEYRGYRIEDLAEVVSYEETAFLLLHGDLPTRSQLAEFDARLRGLRAIPEPLVTLFGKIPKSVHPMDALRTSVSVLAHFDPDVNSAPTDHAANVRMAERMIAQMATAIAYRERIRNGLDPIAPRADLDHAANFLHMVNGAVPSRTMRDAFDLSLVLYTEHELNASTFAARVTVSTLSDIYSGIVAAIGTLKGPLHGGANEEAWKVLEQVGSPENAMDWIEQALARKERIMGFGHRVYKTGDPRSRILKGHCSRLADEIGDDRWERIAEPIERAVTEQKKLPPNVDWPSARLYHYMNLATDIYTPDLRHGPRRGLVRPYHRAARPQPFDAPRARYIGPPNRHVKPIDQR